MKKTHLKRSTAPASETDIAALTAEVAKLVVELPKMEERLNDRMDRQFTVVRERFDALSRDLDARFKKVHEDIDLVLVNVSHLDEKFSPLLGQTVRQLRDWKPKRAVRRV
jgi:hypothetical protein